jgi:hypothetical protein
MHVSLLAFGAHACTEPTSVAAREFKHREHVRDATAPYPIACVEDVPVRARKTVHRILRTAARNSTFGTRAARGRHPKTKEGADVEGELCSERHSRRMRFSRTRS